MINLYNIDCMEFMKDKPDKYYDLAIVDPPYGVNIENRKDINAGNKKKWDDKIPDKLYFDELFRISKNQIIWGLNRFIKYLNNCSMTIIWDKENGNSYCSDYELAWCNVGYNRSRIYRQFWISNMIEKSEKPRIHPCQKPIKLYEWLLSNYAKPSDKIIDTHGGSMSIAIACHNLKFDLDLCELDKDYFEAGKKRYEEHIKQLRMF